MYRIILSLPVVSRGRICVASARESRHHGLSLGRWLVRSADAHPSADLLAAIPARSFWTRFLTELAGLLNRCQAGGFHGQDRKKPGLETSHPFQRLFCRTSKSQAASKALDIPSEFTI